MSPSKRRTTGKAPAAAAASSTSAKLEATSVLPAAGATTRGDDKVKVVMFVRELVGTLNHDTLGDGDVRQQDLP